MSFEGWFPPERQSALRDFWSVYDAYYDELQAAALRFARSHPEFGPLLEGLSSEDVAVQNEASRERMRDAVAGNWKNYEEDLRLQGAVVGEGRGQIRVSRVQAHAQTKLGRTGASLGGGDFGAGFAHPALIAIEQRQRDAQAEIERILPLRFKPVVERFHFHVGNPLRLGQINAGLAGAQTCLGRERFRLGGQIGCQGLQSRNLEDHVQAARE